jgi:hypothetical protein
MSLKVCIAHTTNFLPMSMTPVRIQFFANVTDSSISGNQQQGFISEKFI